MEAIARQAGEAEAARDGSLSGPPLVDITVDGDQVTFVFDFMLLFTTISGSDWYHHHVFTGSARITGGALTDVITTERLNSNVSEHDYEYAKEDRYDRRAVMRELATRR